jgi:NAD(P)-dependent dehydrogenase (short-subunit alcohol dehydrogenase family)
MSATPDTKIGILSARVGSISDNRLGGWHAYRASKAALNMHIRNYALELARKRHGPVIVGLQPGTTDTALSAPFQRNVPEDQLQSPEYTAGQLLKVMQHLQAQDSGQLFDFLGLPFEP